MRGFIEFAQFISSLLLTIGSLIMVINAAITDSPIRFVNVLFFAFVTLLFAAMAKHTFIEYQKEIKR